MDDMTETQEWVTRADAEQIIGRSQTTIRKWVLEGQLEAVGEGAGQLMRLDDLRRIKRWKSLRQRKGRFGAE